MKKISSNPCIVSTSPSQIGEDGGAGKMKKTTSKHHIMGLRYPTHVAAAALEKEGVNHKLPHKMRRSVSTNALPDGMLAVSDTFNKYAWATSFAAPIHSALVCSSVVGSDKSSSEHPDEAWDFASCLVSPPEIVDDEEHGLQQNDVRRFINGRRNSGSSRNNNNNDNDNDDDDKRRS
jgi:hypothetical protein